MRLDWGTSKINQLYRDKHEKVQKAEASGDWRLYIDLHERPYRLHALLRANNKGLKKRPSEFWALVAYVWQDSENIRQNLRKWKRLWGIPIEGRQACMSDEDKHVFNSLPERIVVWRGTSHRRYINGLSWTLDQERAVRFARGFCAGPRVPLVAKGTVSKGDVLAYFGERGGRGFLSFRDDVQKFGTDRDCELIPLE
jgi:hypothetical protein